MQDQNQNEKNTRRDFLRTGAVTSITAAVCGSMLCGCNPLVDTGEGDPQDTVKLLSPEGELVEVKKHHLKHVHKTTAVSLAEARKGIEGKKFVMVVDLAKCNNARKCITACQQMHHLPKHKEWLQVKLMKDSAGGSPYWFPKTCFHCDNPPCVKVCPVDATFKRNDGLVLIDSERCIGCKFCMTACPYSTRLFNWSESDIMDTEEDQYSPETSVPGKIGTVEKCDFCPDMVRMGKLPDCVSACPNGVFYFGDENEDIVTNGSETVRFSKLIQDKSGYRYMEELGTKPRVYYLPPTDRIFPVERSLEDLDDELKARFRDVTI